LEVLPDYMVPAVRVVEHLPFNAAGKVDLRALPEEPSGQVESSYREPEGALARTLAALWQQVLGVERVGLHDNFFDLGGNSLLLMRLQAALEQRLDSSVTLTDLFKFPTVGALAHHLEGGSVPPPDEGEERAVLKRSALARRAQAARLS
jgi:acyl carrier protein